MGIAGCREARDEIAAANGHLSDHEVGKRMSRRPGFLLLGYMPLQQSR